MTYQALFCGDRDWANKVAHPDSWDQEYHLIGSVMYKLFQQHPEMEIIHGAARGADLCADEWAMYYHIPIHAFPAFWNCTIYEAWTGNECKVGGNHSVTHGKAAGPIRNQMMVDEGPDIILAFHDNISISKGTRDMVIKGEANGIETIIYTLEDSLI
jgi:hypothetical protein